MPEQDLYQLLEIERSATPEEIRKAYYRLAKIYHPDLQEGGSSSSTERFLSIQKAYRVLSEPKDREAYDKQLKGDPAILRDTEESFEKKWGKRKTTVQEERNAHLAYVKSEDLIRHGDVDKAIQLMDAVVRTIEDQPEYFSLYGYALALNGERLHQARDACKRAVEMEPYNADFHAHLGYVYLRAGLRQTAEKCFAKALEMNPGQPVALEHAGLAENESGGFWTGLKKIFVPS